MKNIKNCNTTKRKVVGWNINQRSGLGRTIPEVVVSELLDQDAEIIVLTEVVKNDSFSLFAQKMRKAGYELAVSNNREKMNDVCILWKSALYQFSAIDASLVSSKNNNVPNYLMVELKDRNGKTLNVIGYRIRIGGIETSYEGRAQQMRLVIEKLAGLNEPTLIISDSNNFRRGTPRKDWSLSVLDAMLSEVGFKRYTPKGSSIYAENASSVEFEFAEDHVITSGIAVSEGEYDRGFALRDPDTYLHGLDFMHVPVGYPDHALLKVYYEVV